jgi:hypothetical protein
VETDKTALIKWWKSHGKLALAEVGIFAALLLVLHYTGQDKVWFAYPVGIVVGNLIASVIWATPAFLHMMIHNHQKHKKIHGDVKAIADVLDTDTAGGLKEVLDILKDIQTKLNQKTSV